MENGQSLINDLDLLVRPGSRGVGHVDVVKCDGPTRTVGEVDLGIEAGQIVDRVAGLEQETIVAGPRSRNRGPPAGARVSRRHPSNAPRHLRC